MFNIYMIIKKNRETFYDFSTKEKSNTLFYNLIKLLLSLGLALVFSNLNTDFINVVITIFSILIGFSFNVLFYLLSVNKIYIDEKKFSMEKKLKIERINKLSDELFYNVSYFNIVSISVVVISLLYVLFDCRFLNMFSLISNIDIIKLYISDFKNMIILIKSIIGYIYRTVFYFFLFESLYSFVRIIERVSFYFQKKFELQN